MFDINIGVIVQDITINNYKAFKEFKIEFTDKDNNPLPIIVIAGINGTGKTTLLEYLAQLPEIKEKSYKISYKNNENSCTFVKKTNFITNLAFGDVEDNCFQREDFLSHILYIPSEDNTIDNIKEIIPKYLHKIVWSEDVLASIAFKRVREYIDNIFQDFNLKVEFNSRDGDGNLFFKNQKGEIFSIDELSTGEKTLLSKILYLYFKDIKNQIILIDEPELSLHPKWQNQVLKLYENFAKENNCQIIIATHSPHIIGSAKNEYIRLLTEDGVINNSLAYGRDIEWVLEEVMGANYTREPTISKKIEECQKLLEEDKYDEAEKCIDEIENIIGSHDSDIVALRTSLEFWRE